ncbi:hypothetical protein Sjap_000510 [Stephania japonica]|uniref:ALOG domain-containing protein n=1 Tax=Stephania japonica TaxID=461633 RepID=A0AAP0KKR9_9MAGN
MSSSKGKELAIESSGSVDPEKQQKPLSLSRYESQKKRDWNTFCQYLRNQNPPLMLSQCNYNHVLEFLRYIDQFGKTRVHLYGCIYFGKPDPPVPCTCPLRQAWGSLDALIGRLRAAYEEDGGSLESNPFANSNIRIFLREVKEDQARARGITYKKKKRKRDGNKAVSGHITAYGKRTLALSGQCRNTRAASEDTGLRAYGKRTLALPGQLSSFSLRLRDWRGLVDGESAAVAVTVRS